MASLIVFKEKDYEFTYKTRALQLQQTTDNPLRLDRPKVTVQRGRKQNVQIRTKGNFIDPLSRAATNKAPTNPLSRPIDPLARPQTVDPLARPQGKPVQKETPQQKDVQVTQTQQPSKSVEPAQKQPEGKLEIEAEEKQLKNTGEFSIYWQEIREDFQNVFSIKSYDLDQTVPNPFGSQVQSLTQFDGQPKQAYSGDNKIEYQNQAPRSTAVKQILQKTYIQKVLDIRRDLKRQWGNGDKVASLQLAIQSCKLLIDNDKPLFAPVKYVYVIDILETFGKFVIERLLKLSYPQYSDQRIAEISLQSVVGSNISETASEIGRNWINKIGSIRELLPRLYIEATLLKVYYFIDYTQIKPIFYRLVKQVRAIGDYINALNFALYMFRIGAELFSGEKEYLISTLKDFFIYMNQKGRFSKQEVQGDQYLKLFEPYLIQTFRQYSQNCTEREFREIFEHFRQSTQNHFVLQKLIDQFQAVHISSLALELFSIMQAYPVQIKYQLYAVFLPKIAKGLQNKAAGAEICEFVLQDILQIKSFSLFLDILASLIELIFRSFSGYQKNQFFFQILQRFNDLFSMVEKDQVESKQSKETFGKLHQFILKIFQDAEDISEILQIDTFITCIQFFPTEVKKDVCNDLLSIIINRDNKEKITDPMAVHSIVNLAANLNNKKTINKDEAKQLAKIINQLLQKFDFNRDLEQTLNLYAEMRAQFGNISSVSENLIDKALELIFRAKRLSKGKSSQKIVSFYQACIAYSFITIPTIENPISKLRKYTQVAQVGLSLNLLSQSEAIIKTTIETLLEMPETHNGRPIDEIISPYILDLISLILVFPDDPSAGYLNIFQGLLKALEAVKWNQKNGCINRIVVYVNCIQYLSAQVQERLPYHLENVKSNDSLFNKDPQFSLTILDLVQQLYTKLGEFAQEIIKMSITDQIDNGLITKQILSAINRLLLLVKFTKEAEPTFNIFIELIVKKINELNRDRTGKVQLTILKTYTLQTFLNIEKSTSFNYEEKKNQITRILESAKN